MSKEKFGMRIGESVFCIAYLTFVLIASIIFYTSKTNSIAFLYAIASTVLGLGDSFHLVPRIIKNIKGQNTKTEWWMKLGLIITSITMTIFYIFMFYIWKNIHSKNLTAIEISIWILSIVRILICLMPQNNWFKNGNKKLSIIRNIIFLIIGIIEIILFASEKNTYGILTATSILLSFAFYIPVTLYSKENPKIGMLMIPKTIMYVVIISLGFTQI